MPYSPTSARLKSLMSVVLIGANPGVLLHSEGRPVAFASVWSVEWSRWGRGSALMLATESGWITAGSDEHLARILLDRFTRHFPEAAEFGWDTRVHHVAGRTRVDVDAGRGMRARAPGIQVDISDVLDRRHIVEPTFRLGDATVSLSNVYLPCGEATISVDGEILTGAPMITEVDGRQSSTAYLAMAEVWVDPFGALGLPIHRPERDDDAVRGRHLRALRPPM